MIKRIVIVILAIIAAVLGRGAFFYGGFYSAPPTALPRYEHIVAAPPVVSPEFTDNVSAETKEAILVDLAHDNNFQIEELNVLLLRLVSRGLTIKFLGPKDNLKKELLGKVEGEGKEVTLDKDKAAQKEEIKVPNAFIVVCPQEEFSYEEKETIDKFVEKGGKLLLIADPTRNSNINNLSIRFGLIFEPDYLYNMKENEINYRHIFLAEFKENEITKNLAKVALYVAGSISSADSGIAFVDQNTFSTVIESRKRLSPIALVKKSQILAVYDLTFFSEPYSGTADNNQLIANIADWLARAAPHR